MRGLEGFRRFGGMLRDYEEQSVLQSGSRACSQCSTRSGYHCTTKIKKDFDTGGLQCTGEAQAYSIVKLWLFLGGYIHYSDGYNVASEEVTHNQHSLSLMECISIFLHTSTNRPLCRSTRKAPLSSRPVQSLVLFLTGPSRVGSACRKTPQHHRRSTQAAELLCMARMWCRSTGAF